MPKIKRSYAQIAVAALFILLAYSRFIGLDWGLPHPFHPDERNIADAVVGLRPENFFKPAFYAYGQLTIYLAYLIAVIANVLTGREALVITFTQAVMALRLISATASIASVFIALKVIQRLSPTSYQISNILISALLLIFSPALIQFAHFGTTESLLMLLYTLLVHSSLFMVHGKKRLKYLAISAVIVGLAAATKISSVSFALLPAFSWVMSAKGHFGRKVVSALAPGLLFTAVTGVTMFIFSPYNFLNWNAFYSSFLYESAVATGRALVFYTRQFFETVPVLFQLTHIFPYTLGLPVFILFLAGFFTLPKSREMNVLRAALLLYFIPTAFLFTKWSRFMAPVFPVMIICAVLFLLSFRTNVRNLITEIPQSLRSFGMTLVVLAAIIPGLAYLSVYARPDVRFQASEWMLKNIPADAYILSETANVVDLPVSLPYIQYPMSTNYKYVSFDFFVVDENPALQGQLQEHVQNADYIIVMSRRVFANHTCEAPSGHAGLSGIWSFKTRFWMRSAYQNDRCEKLQKQHPILNEYYRKLFSGELGFAQVAEFESYPSFLGIRFPDEQAEETWTVFDHPVIRIYKRS